MPETMTPQQRRALHLWLEMVAKDLTDAGFTMQTVLEKTAEISPTKESMKSIYRNLAEAMFEVESTEELTPEQVSQVVQELSRHLGQHFGITTAFPDRPEYEFGREYG